MGVYEEQSVGQVKCVLCSRESKSAEVEDHRPGSADYQRILRRAKPWRAVTDQLHLSTALIPGDRLMSFRS